MKTAISLQNELLLRADRTAQQMGISRSRLFSLALENYLRQRRKKEILDQLNQVYAEEPSLDELGTLAGMKRRFRSTIRDSWRT